MKDIVIIGAGGVGRETVWIIEQINKKRPTWNIIGFIDDNKQIWDKKINGYKVIGGLSKINELNPKTTIIISIANYSVKKDIVNKINNRFRFAKIVHPDVYIDETTKIGEGTIIYPGVIMTTNIEIGRHAIISPKCGIGHDSIIEDYVALLWNVNISGSDRICEGSLIGSGATIIQNICICSDTVIGAGGIVVRDIQEKGIFVGVPVKKI